MAKKKKVENVEETALVESDKVEEKPASIEDSLTRAELKNYRRQVRAHRRAEWLDEYWIIAILSLVVLALMITLSIGKAVRDRKEEESRLEEDYIDPIEQEEQDTYNIKDQMRILL